MDSTLAVATVLFFLPIATVCAVAYSSRLRGPARRLETRTVVHRLVTEAIPFDAQRDLQSHALGQVRHPRRTPLR
jgi:hypothetical protein